MAYTTTKPNVSMLPMQDIADTLIAQYGIQTSDSNASDVENVAEISSDLIAIAANENGVLIEDRNTINNALKLGGVAAADYMTKQQGQIVTEFIGSSSTVVTDEVATLRDELYQLRAELAKKGFIKYVKPYAGFQDLFMNGQEKYINGEICTATGLTKTQPETAGTAYDTVNVDSVENFSVDDYFVINSGSVFKVVKVKSIGADSIVFSDPVSDISPENIKVFKTIGSYNDGVLSFSNITENTVSLDNEKYTMLNDISYGRKNIDYINTSNSGFALSFNIPEMIAGALSKFIIRTRSIGSPGNLMCYVVRKSYLTSATSLSYSEALSAGQIVATAFNTISSSQATVETDVEFNFYKQGFSYLTVSENDALCFVIEAGENTNSLNKWEVFFAKGLDGSSNVQTNNVTYKFTSETFSQIDYDMYFVMATRPIVTNTETLYNVGLYSAKSALSNPVQASRARLTMRVNREGKFVVNGNSGIYAGNSSISLAKDSEIGTYEMQNGSGIETNDNIIVGTNIRKVTDYYNDSITIEKGVYADNGDPVYRVGYQVFLKAFLKTWDEETEDFVITNEIVSELPLCAVFPDSDINKTETSDRLIFEKTFVDDNDNLVYVNNFEIQIKWRTNIGAIGGRDMSDPTNAYLKDLAEKYLTSILYLKKLIKVV